jgi:hypothetical protein
LGWTVQQTSFFLHWLIYLTAMWHHPKIKK